LVLLYAGWPKEKAGEINSPLQTGKQERMPGSPTKTVGTPQTGGKPGATTATPHAGWKYSLRQKRESTRDPSGSNLGREILLDLKLTLTFNIFLWQAANSFWRKP
jgi:hypothetical protein